jgi:hypothetical protein
VRLLLFALAAALVLLLPAAHAKLPPLPTEAAVVETGRAPCGLAAFGRELWVGVYETGMVLRLDRAGRVQRRHRIGRFACQIAVDERAAWVTRDNADELVRVDARSGALRRIRIVSPRDVALAAGSVWVTSFEAGTLTRIDRRTARRTGRWRIGGHPTGITLCAGKLLVGQGRGATWITSVDPRTGRAKRLDVVVSTPRLPQCLDGELWVTTETEALRISPRTGELRGHFSLGATLAAAGLGASATAPAPRVVWVTNKERSLVHRIDPASGHVIDSFPAGPGALAQARFGGSVWISSFAGSDVRRYDP